MDIGWDQNRETSKPKDLETAKSKTMFKSYSTRLRNELTQIPAGDEDAKKRFQTVRKKNSNISSFRS